MSEKGTATKTALEPISVKGAASKDLSERFEKIYEEVAKRAFLMFENDGIFGHDFDNWIKAETELLHPVRVNVTEVDGAVQIEAEVPGFEAQDLEVTLEPQRLIISGKREIKEESKKGKTIYKEESSNEILRAVSLPFEVEAAKATAVLKNGVLELHAPKSANATTAKVEVKAA
jgi:HSP20 family protein